MQFQIILMNVKQFNVIIFRIHLVIILQVFNSFSFHIIIYNNLKIVKIIPFQLILYYFIIRKMVLNPNFLKMFRINMVKFIFHKYI